jgi:hypothetical protein
MTNGRLSITAVPQQAAERESMSIVDNQGFQRLKAMLLGTKLQI